MQSTDKSGYKKKISQYVVHTLHGASQNTHESHLATSSSNSFSDDDNFSLMEHQYAIAVQSAWRKKAANVFVSALKQEKDCIIYRQNHPELHPIHHQPQIRSCAICRQDTPADTTGCLETNTGINGSSEGGGSSSVLLDDSELKQKHFRQKFKEIEKMLFFQQRKVTINDLGDNWNKRYQRIINLSENTILERTTKYSELSILNHDFVNTAKTYAQTIISEYFLHTKDKTIHAMKIGGVAGGQVSLSIYISLSVSNSTSLSEISVARNSLQDG
jgi:hypothetical protein